jgi:hypothetical protein
MLNGWWWCRLPWSLITVNIYEPSILVVILQTCLFPRYGKRKRQFHFEQKEFEETKGAIRLRISKNRPHNGQRKKIQKDKQRFTKHTYKTKDRVTRTPLKTGGELRCSGRVGSSCSNSGTRRVTLVTNPGLCYIIHQYYPHQVGEGVILSVQRTGLRGSLC